MKTICNVCRKRTDIGKPDIRTEGDLEIQYITCPSCGQEYIVAVTDPGLRKQIKSYDRLQQKIKNGNAAVGVYRKAEELHQENVMRCQQLIAQYLGIE
ncbi:MAG: hypothetical protein IJV41_02625 [Oscillospiraceae bacterium]|nr:hypothetical protein [Oscillospiraceae bacterium]